MTRAAAPVLGFDDRGTISAGMRADLACWNVDRPAELTYWMGPNPCTAVINAGRLRALS